MASGVVIMVDRAIEIRAIRRGELVTVTRSQSHGQTISGHRNETLTLQVCVARNALAFAELDRENAA